MRRSRRRRCRRCSIAFTDEVGGQAGARIPRPQDQLCRAARRRGSGRLRAHGPGRRPGHRGCALPAEHALSSPLVLRRPQGRRAHRASLAARCRARACLQAEGLRRAHPDHHQRRLHGPAGAEAQGRWPGRPPDRRRRHGLRALRHPDHADCGRRAGHPLRQAARGRRQRSCRGSGRRSTWRTSRCCNTPAAPPASPRAPCSAMPTSAPPARSTRLWGDPQRISEPGDRQDHLRAAAVPHLRAHQGAAARPAGGQRAAAARALRRRDHARRHRGQEGDRVPGRADHVDRARQHARTSTSATSPRCAMRPRAARRFPSRWPSASRS